MTKTYTPHKHADVLRAIAEGIPVQAHYPSSPEKGWQDIDTNLSFSIFLSGDVEYRIKPEEAVDYAMVHENGVVASQFYPSTRHVYSFTGASHYELRQGFVKRTRIDGKVISFEFISK